MNPPASVRTGSPRALTAVGIFLTFGAGMAAFAGTTSIWRGTALDKIWTLNKSATSNFLLLEDLSEAFSRCSVPYLWPRRRAWRLVVGIVATQVTGDVVNFAEGDYLRGDTLFALASALRFYLLRPNTRAEFR